MIQIILPNRPIMPAVLLIPYMRHSVIRQISMRPVTDMFQVILVSAGKKEQPEKVCCFFRDRYEQLGDLGIGSRGKSTNPGKAV